MTETEVKRNESNEITEDYFFKKKIFILQNKKGYRFSIDAPILADFLPARPQEEALEIGTGCGIIALLALYKKKFARVYGIEIRESLFKLAQLNAERNGFLEQFQPVLNDFTKNYRDFAGIKTIFSNPPFFEPHRGRQSPNPEIRDAKTETSLTLKDLLLKSRDILPKDGSLFIIIPYHRFDDLTALTQKIDFFPHRVREVFSFADGKPGRFLIQLSSTNVPLQKMAPLIIFKEKGIYTEEMDKILTG